MKRFAILVFGLGLVSATSAQANQWYIENPEGEVKGGRKRIPVGQVVEVPTAGSVIVRLRAGPHSKVQKEKCSVAGVDALSNSETDALDEVVSLTFTCRKNVTVTASRLPWHGVLEGNGEPFDEPVTGMALEVTIKKQTTLYTGSLTAHFGDFDNPSHDDIDNNWKVRGGQAGELIGPGTRTLQLSGLVKYGEQQIDRADGQRNGEPEEIGGTEKED